MRAARDIYRVLETPTKYRTLIRDLDQEIDQIRAHFCAGSPGMSLATGRGGGKRDLSCYYARVEDLIKCRKAAYDRYEMSVQRVLAILEGCEKAPQVVLCGRSYKGAGGGDVWEIVRLCLHDHEARNYETGKRMMIMRGSLRGPSFFYFFQNP